MKTFTNQDVENYYDHTEPHYRMWWKLDASMGLHYGVWDKEIRNLKDAVINTNRELMLLGEIPRSATVLDAGCGVGGSSIFLAKERNCRAKGITLSARQVATANQYAQRHEVQHLVQFEQKDYTDTGYAPASFDYAWAIESMQTAPDKSLFFKEIARVLKPGGRLLIADCFKSHAYDINQEPDMQTMLNGWAISDILTLNELEETAGAFGLRLSGRRNVSKEVKPSVNRIYWAALAGMIGTKAYNLVYNATYFSKIHYKTGLAQYKTYRRELWDYELLAFQKM